MTGYIGAGAVGTHAPSKAVKSPLTLLGASLIEWWSADSPATMSLVGSTISAWVGRKAGYTVTQPTAGYRPVFNATSFGGAPGVTFDGVDDNLSLTGVPATVPIGANPCEVWAIVQQDASAADSTTRRIFAYGGSGTNNTVRYMTKGGGSAVLVINVGTGAAVPSTSPSGAFNARHVVRGQFGAAASKVSLDNSADASVAAVPATASDLFCIGIGTNTAGPWQGKIRDILITSPLSVSQASLLMAWALPRRKL